MQLLLDDHKGKKSFSSQVEERIVLNMARLSLEVCTRIVNLWRAKFTIVDLASVFIANTLIYLRDNGLAGLS